MDVLKTRQEKKFNIFHNEDIFPQLRIADAQVISLWKCEKFCFPSVAGEQKPFLGTFHHLYVEYLKLQHL